MSGNAVSQVNMALDSGSRGGQTPPSSAAVWFKALRAYSLPASLVPTVFGVAVAGAAGASVPGWVLPVVVLAGVLAHLGTNLINDAVDYAQGVDSPETAGGSGVLVSGWLSGRAVTLAAYGLFAASGGIGLALVAWRGWPLLAIGLVGIAGGYFYTAPPLSLKYRRLGEPTVFLLMGPLMAAGAAFVAAGRFPEQVWAASVPIGFLVTTILAANNLRDRDDDRARGVKTVSNALGWRGAQIEVLALLWAAYAAVPVLVALRVLGPYSLLCLLTAPLAVRLTRQILRARPASFPAGLVEQVAQLHLLHGILLTVGPLVTWLR